MKPACKSENLQVAFEQRHMAQLGSVDAVVMIQNRVAPTCELQTQLGLLPISAPFFFSQNNLN